MCPQAHDEVGAPEEHIESIYIRTESVCAPAESERGGETLRPVQEGIAAGCTTDPTVLFPGMP